MARQGQGWCQWRGPGRNQGVEERDQQVARLTEQLRAVKDDLQRLAKQHEALVAGDGLPPWGTVGARCLPFGRRSLRPLPIWC